MIKWAALLLMLASGVLFILTWTSQGPLWELIVQAICFGANFIILMVFLDG